MNPQHLTRLHEEQAKALSDTDKQILQVEKYKNDYQVLQKRLRTLPDEITYDVMVPFGKLAFMPGNLVHTNEILVLLGDNWFVERSAKQAEDIAQRRIEELNKQLKNLKAQKKLLEPRLEFTSDFQGNKDVKEIVEEYDAEKERLWDEQHRKNVLKEKEATKNVNLKSSSKSETIEKHKQTDAYLWARLDALEEEEKNRREMESDDSEEEGECDKAHPRRIKSDDLAIDVERLESDDYSEYERSEDVVDGDDEDNSSEESETGDGESSNSTKPDIKTIRFTHSDSTSHHTKTVDSSGDATILSPADIYKLYCPPSILKKPGSKKRKENLESASFTSKVVEFSSNDNNDHTQKSPSDMNIKTPLASNSAKAFSGMVSETSQSIQRTGPNLALHERQQEDEPPKRVSKFKASRMGQQGFS